MCRPEHTVCRKKLTINQRLSGEFKKSLQTTEEDKIMNCVNCGASLEIDQLRQIRHCPYCGAELEMKDETPDTMAGTIHGIAKTFFNQTADKIRYNREHAVEIAEQRRKDKAEEARQSRKMMMYMMGGMAALMTVMVVVMRITGAWA